VAAQGKTPGRTSRTCTLAKPEVDFLIRKARPRLRRCARGACSRSLHRRRDIAGADVAPLQAEALVGVPQTHMELPQARSKLALIV
jgi:hypothetical protein